MARRQRWWAAAALGVILLLTGESLLLLLLIAAVGRAAAGQAPEQPDRVALWAYVALVLLCSLLSMIQVPGLPR